MAWELYLNKVLVPTTSEVYRYSWSRYVTRGLQRYAKVMVLGDPCETAIRPPKDVVTHGLRTTEGKKPKTKASKI